MYSIDFEKLINNLLPWFMRKSIMKAWLGSLITTVISLYEQFLSYAASLRWDLSITGQTVLLEIMLNTKFYGESDLRKIFISDNDLEARIYLFNISEVEESAYLFNISEESDPVYIFNFSERTVMDFTVWVPDTLEFDTNYMTGLVKRNKIAGPSFDIKTYTE